MCVEMYFMEHDTNFNSPRSKGKTVQDGMERRTLIITRVVCQLQNEILEVK